MCTRCAGHARRKLGDVDAVEAAVVPPNVVVQLRNRRTGRAPLFCAWRAAAMTGVRRRADARRTTGPFTANAGSHDLGYRGG